MHHTVESIRHTRPIIVIATALTVAVVVLNLVSEFTNRHHLDKFSFDLAIGFAVMFFTSSAWALKSESGGVAAYIFCMGLVLLCVGSVFTNADSIRTLSIEAMDPTILGAVSTIFVTAFQGEKEQ